jgi:hypothetical protein
MRSHRQVPSGGLASPVRAIREIREDTPSLSDDRIRHGWDACLRKAHREAEGELNRGIPHSGLSWEKVFEAPYALEGNQTATL